MVLGVAHPIISVVRMWRSCSSFPQFIRSRVHCGKYAFSKTLRTYLVSEDLSTYDGDTCKYYYIADELLVRFVSIFARMTFI